LAAFSRGESDELLRLLTEAESGLATMPLRLIPELT
jgi:hypothetical protein